MNRHSKSRSGCRVCKRKRLKCDEAIPACLNCTRRGIECPGYQQAFRWSTKHESGRATRSTVPPGFSQLASAVSQSIQIAEQTVDHTSPAQPSGLPNSPTRPSTAFLRPPDVEEPQYPVGQSPSEAYSETPGAAGDVSPSVNVHQSSNVAILDDEERYLAPAPQALLELLGTEFLSDPNSISINTGDLSESGDGEEDPTDLRDVDLLPAASQPLECAPDPVQSLNEPSTFLVEFWFRSVCGSWAAYDSPSNPFRRLCSSLWASSGSVFYSIQSMAAASLPVHSPSVKEIALMAPQMSTQALIQELDDLFREPNAVLTLPAGLLVSLFCMSSSLSWIDSRQLGIQYLRNARAVLDLLDMRAHCLSTEDKKLLEFFRGCLIYEEMLRSIVSNDEDDIRALLDWRPPSYESGVLSLHSWTGVPANIVCLFGKVMVLCRRSRRTWRRSAHATYTLMYQAMLDIQEGKELEEKLLAIDVPGIADPSPDETDSEDPDVKDHLYLAAEAFRLSSLLQLYQTFPDLVCQRLPCQVAADGLVPQDRWLNPLALHIVEILKQIPPTSGMRCLQPLLCICAGSALRYEDDTDGPKELGLPSRGNVELWVGSRNIDVFTSPSAPNLDSVEIREARGFLRQRLDHLEQSLPRKPIAVARQLLEEIWLTVDKETPPKRSHWLDIMTTGRFESVFG